MKARILIAAALLTAACANDKGKENPKSDAVGPQGCEFVLEKNSPAEMAASAYVASKKCGVTEAELERILASEEKNGDTPSGD